MTEIVSNPNLYINKLTHFLILSTKRYRLSYWHVKIFGYNFDSSMGHSILRRYCCWGSQVIEIHYSKNPSWQHLSKYIHVKSTGQAHAQGCCANSYRKFPKHDWKQQEKIFLMIKKHFLLLLANMFWRLFVSVSTMVLCMCFYC